MKQREDRHYQMIVKVIFFRVFLSVFFPVKVSHFTILFLSRLIKKLTMRRIVFLLTPHANLHSHKKAVYKLSGMRGNSRVFARPWSPK